MKSLRAFLARWDGARARAATVLSMNRRNLHYIYTRNQRKHFPLADDKLLAKEVLMAAGVRMPETYRTYSHFYQLRNLERELEVFQDFVIKPAQGSGGNGIIVIVGRSGRDWLGISGKIYTLYDLQKHISDIIFGVFSFDLGDRAIIESRIIQHAEMQELSPLGLADVRVIMCDDMPVMSMTRIPTRQSDGKANLHQGALGVAIDIASGVTTHGRFLGEPMERHPDSGIHLIGRTLPYWPEIIELARLAARAVPLKYLGVDISISPDGPQLLEINVRPGLEIQNVNERGMLAILQAMTMKDGSDER
ncbi:MAG TPA: sugar-transfer associated ATP-grasp domain-containing protein [Gallionella sp.]|nr:sugar-transfer associated ATP-grasp domain-containing protein [Gallionella sp.]